MKLDEIFTFIQLTQKFRAVIRDLHVGHEERFENDMEHSYQLSIFLWYLVSTNSLPYDINKLIRYALIHDLVETYAGDTPALTSSQEIKSSKSTREEAAFQRIMSEIPEFTELEKTWKEYQSKADPESRLVYVLDKVMPILNEIQQDSKFYKNNQITLAKWQEWLKSKLDAVSYNEIDDAGFISTLMNYLKSNQNTLFFET